MTDIKIISETPISMLDLREKLKRIEKNNKELTERGKKTKDYLDNFVILDSKKAVELKEKIIKLEIPRLKDRHLVKIFDIMPTNIDSVRALFTGDPITIKQEDLQKIADVVKEYI